MPSLRTLRGVLLTISPHIRLSAACSRLQGFVSSTAPLVRVADHVTRGREVVFWGIATTEGMSGKDRSHAVTTAQCRA